MTRRTSVPIMLSDTRLVSKWLESLGQCTKSIMEDIDGGAEFFVAYVRGKPAVLGWCQVSDCTICMNVDPSYVGQGIACSMLEFLEERLAIAITRQSVVLV